MILLLAPFVYFVDTNTTERKMMPCHCQQEWTICNPELNFEQAHSKNQGPRILSGTEGQKF
jgi:hypothetical protein